MEIYCADTETVSCDTLKELDKYSGHTEMVHTLDTVGLSTPVSIFL